MSGPLPLLGLRAFTEVGLARSVTAASRNLGVTPGAVSQQVKLLEARLGVALFERRARELRLTPVGKRLLDDLVDGFGRIEAALERLQREQRQPALVVTTTGAFAATWLVPRLGRFTALHPHIDVQVLSSPELVPIGTGLGEADLAIRHGLGEWPGLQAIRLLQPRLLPVGSPDLLRRGPPIRQPEDCLRYPLLHDAMRGDWRLWLQALGANHRDPLVARGSRFSDSALLVRAAVAGQGLALLRDTYVADDIAAGRLAVALDAPWPAQFGYYAVTRESALHRRPQIAAFRDWLVQEAKAEP